MYPRGKTMDRYWYLFRCRRCGNPAALQIDLPHILHCPVCDKMELVRDKSALPVRVAAGEPVQSLTVTEPKPITLTETGGYTLKDGKLEKPVCTGGGTPREKKKPRVGKKRGKRPKANICPYCKKVYGGSVWYEKHLKRCPKKPKEQIVVTDTPRPTEREIREANKERAGR
jgi:uncharacterized Zn-finger protein